MTDKKNKWFLNDKHKDLYEKFMLSDVDPAIGIAIIALFATSVYMVLVISGVI